MNEPLDELYLQWLYSQVGSLRTRDKTKTYWSLLRILYAKEFVWIIPNDDNRMEDGRDLRFEFVKDSHFKKVDAVWMGLGCSVLEMLIALSRRLSFEADREPSDWFWHLIDNLGLTNCRDSSDFDYEWVDEKLETLIWRTYNEKGVGGLFPLKKSEENQREVEIWYQLCAYLIEQEYF